MSDRKKWKKWSGLLAVLVLLSFLYTASVFAENLTEMLPGYYAAGTEAGYEYAGAEGAGFAEQSALSDGETGHFQPAVITDGDNPLSSSIDSISLAKNAQEDIEALEEQSQNRMLLFRFVAVMCMLVLLVCVICRILGRRYGCHMIAVWQNIYYIHRVDGKKGERFSVYIA